MSLLEMIVTNLIIRFLIKQVNFLYVNDLLILGSGLGASAIVRNPDEIARQVS